MDGSALKTGTKSATHLDLTTGDVELQKKEIFNAVADVM